MKYLRFEELPVWNASVDLADKVFCFVDDKAFDYQGDLRRQLAKAALSVSNNIAEGFERSSNKELTHFLYIARGSAGEVRSMLHVIARNERYAKLEVERRELFGLVESTRRQLKGWIDSLEAKRQKDTVRKAVSALIITRASLLALTV